MATEKTNKYEAMFLFGSNFANEIEGASNICRKIIESHGGQVQVLKKWDERKLAYELGGNKRGVYFLSMFTAPTSAVAQIERDVRLSEEVLRVLVLRADHLTADELQAMEPQKPEPREERPDRGFGDRGGFGGGYGDRPARPRREEGAGEAVATSDKPE